MTHDELNTYEMWECHKNGYIEYIRTNTRLVIEAGKKYQNLIGLTTGTAKQILRNQGWIITVNRYNRKDTEDGRG